MIESNVVRAKPAPAKDDGSAKRALKKTPPKAASAAPAAPSVEVLADSAKPSPPTGTDAAPVSVNANTAPLPAPAPAAPVESAAVPEPAKLAALAQRPERVALTLVTRVEPALPRDLIDSRLDTANVVVAFTVNPDGEVSNLSVASSTDPRLSKSVLRAVRGWRYAPIPEAREHKVSFSFKSE